MYFNSESGKFKCKNIGDGGDDVFKDNFRFSIVFFIDISKGFEIDPILHNFFFPFTSEETIHILEPTGIIIGTVHFSVFLHQLRTALNMEEAHVGIIEDILRDGDIAESRRIDIAPFFVILDPK